MRIFAKDLHKTDTPWDHAPLYGFELYAITVLTLTKVEAMMAAIDDLKSSIDNLQTQAAALNGKVDHLLANPPTVTGTSDADIAAQVSRINDTAASLQAEAGKLP